MAQPLTSTLAYEVPLRSPVSSVDTLEYRLEYITAQRRIAAERCEAFLSMLERHMEAQQLDDAAARRDPPQFIAEEDRRFPAPRDYRGHSPSWQPRRSSGTRRRNTEPAQACPTCPNPNFQAPSSPRSACEAVSRRRASGNCSTSSARLMRMGSAGLETASRSSSRRPSRTHSVSAISVHPSSPLAFPSEDLTCGFYARPRSISRTNTH